jgi:hypothetical protein
MMAEEVLRQAILSPRGLVGQAGEEGIKALRAARTKFAQHEPALHDISILGPDNEGQVWVVKLSALRDFMSGSQYDGRAQQHDGGGRQYDGK